MAWRKRLCAHQPEVLVQTDTPMTVSTLLLAVALLVSACSEGNVAPAPSITLRTATVAIPAYRFEPSHLEVVRGTVVTWQSQDRDRHILTTSPAPAIPLKQDGSYDTSGSLFVFTLDFGDQASFAFNKAGTVYYYCMVHNVMKGTVVVR